MVPPSPPPTRLPARAITLWPELAAACLYLGRDIDVRSWAPRAGLAEGDWLCLHAASAPVSPQVWLQRLQHLAEQVRWTGQFDGCVVDRFRGADQRRPVLRLVAWSEAGTVSLSLDAQWPGSLPIHTGAIVGVARLCRIDGPGATTTSPWDQGDLPPQRRHTFSLAPIVPLAAPLAVVGGRKHWAVPATLREAPLTGLPMLFPAALAPLSPRGSA